MAWVNVEVLNVEEVTARYGKALASAPDLLEKAQRRAMQRAGDKAKTQAKRYAAATYQISAGTFSGNVRETIEGAGTAMMTITFAGAAIPLKNFKISTGYNGVKVSVKGGGGTLAHAFTDYKMGGGVFERVGKSRLPIRQLYGPATGSMMKDEGIRSEMDTTISEEYESRLEHEVGYILSGLV